MEMNQDLQTSIDIINTRLDNLEYESIDNNPLEVIKGMRAGQKDIIIPKEVIILRMNNYMMNSQVRLR